MYDDEDEEDETPGRCVRPALEIEEAKRRLQLSANASFPAGVPAGEEERDGRYRGALLFLSWIQGDDTALDAIERAEP